MWTFPVILDSRPGDLPGTRGGSHLLAPLGDGTVLGHLRARLASVTGAPPVIATTFEVDEAYEKAIGEACPDVEAVETLSSFVERLYTYHPSDRLLLAHPGCFLLDARDPALARFSKGQDPRRVTHLVALERGDHGTIEHVDADASGRIRAIQRYYDSVTWPFAGGVAATLVPVASLRVARELPLADLPRLRRILSAEDVPTRDIPLERGAVNLCSERGLLAMNQAMALSLSRQRPGRSGRHSSLHAGEGTRVHPSASVVGPVVLQEGAEIGENVTLIGPAVIGRGARVEAGATVAQSVVGPGQVVPAGTTLRHCVFLGGSEGDDPGAKVSASGEGGAVELEWETTPLELSADTTTRSVHPGVKRAIDATVAALGLVLLAPLWLLIAALIRLESRGPILFGHVREGMGGRTFRCWKFRTMILGADQQQRKLAKMNKMDGPQFKVEKDPRRTRMGRLLAATNLDEIPQLWNVLVGEMSLVGPRPSPFRENQVCVPWRQGRLSVRPGVTGLWQICRHDRDRGDFHQWIYYDLLYVNHQSLWLDFKILALTPLSFARSGYISLRWLLPRHRYGERRASQRAPQGLLQAKRSGSTVSARGALTAPSRSMERIPHDEDGTEMARRKALIPGSPHTNNSSRGVRRRDLGEHDEVLPNLVLSRDPRFHPSREAGRD